MKLKVYALRDSKADAFATPMFVQNDSIAVRCLKAALQDTSSALAVSPSDFGLFCLGEFDNLDASFKMLPVPFLLCYADNLPGPLSIVGGQNAQD